ncbi:hypothetical protein GCM10007881_62910 [Mesorhizobium huakuii]|uniref:caspase family protein n=1 Tax=Mesorhizobium huakuii TaxID=28104 RepID=UPI00235C2E14|nr:caspase family protein [Mesorhizobium huakuii]GLQ82768.1 hypothetical protein GCM10007881_62910 [Mesorhizobium huakuii]
MAEITGEDGLVYNLDGDGGRTHVFIVALGHYPFFRDGGPAADADAPLKQLVSPPRSARLMADWFIHDYNYPPAQLGSVALMISEQEPAPYTSPSGDWLLRVPTYDAFAKAAEVWINRGMTSEKNRMVFLFCGHGYGYGREASLLMADFDFRSLNKWEQALDLGLFHHGLERCAADEQIFLIDACRRPHGDQAAPDAAIGRSPIHPDQNGRKAFQTRRNAPLFFSTGDAQPARGRSDGASVFTDAFLRSVAGMAANDDNGDWRVNNYLLLYALSHVSFRLTAQEFPEPQQPQGGEARLFDFHYLKTPPISPIYVARQDNEPCGPGELRIEIDGASQTRECTADELEVELPLPLGAYSFELAHGGGLTLSAKQSSRPTFKKARLS